MDLKFLFLLMALLVTLSSSSSTSDNVFESQTSVSGRNLLEAKKKCEVNFESKDYTGMTKRCKPPAFPAEECCSAFKEFACPYANEINDMDSDCARIMFSYMNVYGKYPPGLFANECKESKEGLVCPSPPVTPPTVNASTAPPRFFSPLMIYVATAVSAAFLVFGLM